MIKFALICESGHEFESWFRDGTAYETQAKRGFVTCPVCDSAKVGKAIMAPAVKRRDRGAEEATAPASEAAQPMALLDENATMLRSMIRELRTKILENATDVGDTFPQEARKMHDGEAPKRAIHGNVTGEEAKALIDEGIEIMPIPTLPEDRN